MTDNEGGKTVRATDYITLVREDLREIDPFGRVIFQKTGKFSVWGEVYDENVTDQDLEDLWYAVTTYTPADIESREALPEGWSTLDALGRDANERAAAEAHAFLAVGA